MQIEIFISQSRRLRPGHDRVAGQTRAERNFVTFHEIFDLGRVRALWIQNQITFEMMERVQRIVHFIVIKKSQFKMHFRGLGRAVEGGFVKIDRPEVIALGRLPVRFFDQACIPRGDHAIARAQEHQN